MGKKELCPICGEQSGGGTFLCLGCGTDQWVHPKCGGYTKSEVQAAGKTAAKNDLRCNNCKKVIFPVGSIYFCVRLCIPLSVGWLGLVGGGCVVYIHP